MKSWVITFAFALIAYGVVQTQQADRDSSGALVSEGNIGAFEIRVGDCFNDGTDITPDGDHTEVLGVDGVPCTMPHDNEVYAVFDVAGTNFPGNEDMQEMAYSGCIDRFETFVGRDYQSSELDVYPLFPTAESWSQMNDREVVCALFDMSLAKLEGSMRGSGI